MNTVSRVLIFCYVISIILTLAIFPFLPYITGINNLLWLSGIADFIATLFIFGCSVYYDNSSIYDPYWSAAPIVFVPIFTFYGPFGLNLRNILINILITFWGWRLIWIALSRWTDLSHEDFRYKLWRDRLSSSLSSSSSSLSSASISYWIFSFFSFHLFPTVLVFLGIIPTYIALTGDVTALGISENTSKPISEQTLFGVTDVVATLITGGAFLLETQADRQLRQFQNQQKHYSNNESNKIKRVIDTGLWSFCRHPNYLGEILFWWGQVLYALSMEVSFPHIILACIGATGITALIAFGSLPMMEDRMEETRPEQWKKYKATVPYKLIPFIF